MAEYACAVEIARPVNEIFDFLARPANLVRLAPPEMHLELVEGPDRLQIGSVVHWKARRMGVSQTLANEVTAFEEGVLIIEEQLKGPFKRWTLTHRFATTAGGVLLTEEASYEPPGGLLGLLISAAAIHKDLEHLFAFRAERLRAIFP